MHCENNKYNGFLGVPLQLAGRAFRYIFFTSPTGESKKYATVIANANWITIGDFWPKGRVRGFTILMIDG